MTALDIKFRQIVVDMLAEYGQAATYTRRTGRAYNPETSEVSTSAVPTAVRTLKVSPDSITSPQSILLRAGSIQANEALFYLAAQTLGAEPRANDTVTLADGTTWTISIVETINSGTQDALYIVRAGR